MVAATMASSQPATRFARKHYNQWTSKERIRASKRRTQQCPGLSPVLLISPHLCWFSATTVSLNHFSSHPSEAGNSGLTSHKRTVTELKIDVSLDWL